MRQFSVSCLDEGEAARMHRMALASLPARFRLVSGEGADVVVSASSADLPADIRVAVVTDPGAARAAAVPVFPAWTFLPRLEADDCFLDAREHATVLICCTTMVAGTSITKMRAAFLEQLAVLRSLTGVDPAITAMTRNETGFTALGDLGATTIALAAASSPLGRNTLRLSAVGSTRRLDVVVDASARPVSIRLFGRHGSHEAIPIHQSTHRLTWLHIHKLLSEPDTVPSTAAVSDSDLICASRWLGDP